MIRTSWHYFDSVIFIFFR